MSLAGTFIVFGSWRLRHDEPVPAHQQVVCLVPAEQVVLSDRLLLLDLRPLVSNSVLHAVPASPQANEMLDVLRQPGSGNLHPQVMPLGVVSVRDGQATISHLVTRIEDDVVQLLQTPDEPRPLAQIWSSLQAHYNQNHLSLNNWECNYRKGMPDTELEQKFAVSQKYQYYAECVSFMEELGAGKIAGFVPQLGDEVQHWSYDNHFAKVLPNAKNEQGYVSIMFWCKQKHRWDEPRYTFKKKLFVEDALERWERNYAGILVEGSPQEALERFFEFSVQPLPSWRRSRLDIACESRAHANVFMVNFECTQIWNESDPKGRLHQVEIEYLKTRGHPNEAAIYEDFHRLCEQTSLYLGRSGLDFERTNYSKLTFLEDYVRGKQP